MCSRDFIIVDMPEKVANSSSTFEHLLATFKEISYLEQKSIIFDFKNTNWFDANLSAFLGAIFRYLLSKKNKVFIDNMSESISTILKKNNFLKTFSLEDAPDVYNTTVEFRVFKQENRTEFQSYIDENLIPKISISMSEGFKSIFSSALDEIYQNARTHGESADITACGQWFPTRSIVKFTICDIGVTIPENVGRLHPQYSPKEAINWATQYGTSTKPEGISGGVGLDYLKKFIRVNGGKLHIISGQGYWGYDGNITMKDLAGYFNGTVVNLEINLNDCKMYACESEMGIIDNSASGDMMINIF